MAPVEGNSEWGVMGTARATVPRWRSRPIGERLAVVRRFRIEVARRVGELAALVSSRTLDEAGALSAEVLPFLEACRFLERRADRILSTSRLDGSGAGWFQTAREVLSVREPYGVVGVIAPSNYRFFIGAVQALQALVAGNVVIWKPGIGGGSSALWMRRVWEECGGDDGLLQVIGEGQEEGRILVESLPDLVVFTGSSEVGCRVAERCGALGIPTILEASGCDACVLLDDADVVLAAKALVFGLCLNGGRTCIAPRRVIVARSVFGAFEEALRCEMSGIAGVVWESGAVERVADWVKDATDAGARMLGGGKLGEGVCVLMGCEASMRIVQEDPHAPVAAVLCAEDEEDAVRISDACEYGLGASVFGRDLDRARRFARRLKAGTVTINDVIVPTADPRVGFGGWGKSGWGVTRGREGLLSMTHTRNVHVCDSKTHAHLGGMRPSAGFFRACAWFRHGEKRLAGIAGMLGGVIGMVFGKKPVAER